MTEQTHQTERIDRNRVHPKGDPHSAGGEHVSTEDVRQAEIVLDTPAKRILIVGIFVVGLIVLGVLIGYA